MIALVFLAVLGVVCAGGSSYGPPGVQYGQPLGPSAVVQQYGVPQVQQYLTQQYAPSVQYATPVAKAVAIQPEDYDHHPQYQYGYSVSDSTTGDHKSASERRDGDYVEGHYSLLDSDGSIRTVRYTADSVNGFNAVVDRQPAAVKAVAVHSAPAVQYGPAVQYASAPVQYAPAIQYTHAAPVHYSAPKVTTYTSAAPAVRYGVISTNYGEPSTNYGAPTVTGGYA